MPEPLLAKYQDVPQHDPVARNLELEAQIAESPDDVALYSVYADWLSQHDDPRGEWINVSLALEAKPGDEALVEARSALLKRHGQDWLGDLVVERRWRCTWRHGFIDRVELGDVATLDHKSRTKIDHARAYQTLRSLPTAALMRELVFGQVHHDAGEPSWDDCVMAIATCGVPPTLRHLAFDRGPYWDISWTHLSDLEPAYRELRHLRLLYIELGHMGLGKIELPALESFEVYTGGFDEGNMRSVIDAEWPNLERLVLRFGNDEERGGTCTLADALPLLDKPLPKLRHLAIANAGFTDDFVAPLAKSRLLAQLTSLDLSMGVLSDEGVAHIFEHSAAFQHLEKLDISQSYVSAESITRLRTIVRAVEAEQNGRADPGDRYCAIGE